jgi:hypothetical protein
LADRERSHPSDIVLSEVNCDAGNPWRIRLTRDRLNFLFLNIGHFLDHLFTLIFATVAAVALSREWTLSYGELLKYATPGFFAFGAFALPAGRLADKWSREGMMGVFFIGIGLASIATSFARTPFEIGLGLFVIEFLRRYTIRLVSPSRGDMEKHRPAHCHEWRVGQSRCRQRSADNGILHRSRRLAYGLCRTGECLYLGRTRLRGYRLVANHW